MTARISIFSITGVLLLLSGLRKLALSEAVLGSALRGVGVAGLKLTGFAIDAKRSDCHAPNRGIDDHLRAVKHYYLGSCPIRGEDGHSGNPR